MQKGFKMRLTKGVSVPKFRVCWFLAILFLAGKQEVACARSIPVLLFLNSNDQPDSLGYNLVKALPALVYPEIMNGRIELWDSPQKEIRIKPTTLQRLEQSTGTLFGKCQQLFIYELWDVNHTKSDFQTVGFYFSTRSLSGEEVSYGYVDEKDIDSLINNSLIPVDANGNCRSSFREILDQKYYYFNVVQYGDRKVSGLTEALSIRRDAESAISQRRTPPGSSCREITYFIDDSVSGDAPQAKNSILFLNSWSSYLDANKEFYFNLGGDRISGLFDSARIRVESAEVHEIWFRKNDSLWYTIQNIRLWVKGKPLDRISGVEIDHSDLICDYKSLKDFLLEKEFYFRISRINSQEIPAWQSEAFRKGLMLWRWNAINEFVKYE